jgi:hypothetical protein
MRGRETARDWAVLTVVPHSGDAVPGWSEDVLAGDHKAGVEQGRQIRDQLIRAGEVGVRTHDAKLVTRTGAGGRRIVRSPGDTTVAARIG